MAKSGQAFALIGDVAHLMKVFVGEGMNMAMLNALELVESIIRHPEDLATAVVEHIEKILPKATELQ
jgi:2-polyprenyl-6-methoxyphenol hydroxylase-like FAD-dependent oxidoreductase